MIVCKFSVKSRHSDILGIYRDVLCTVSHNTCIISISQLVQCSFGVKRHLAQTCFDGSCTRSCSALSYDSTTGGEKICCNLDPFQIELQIYQKSHCSLL